MARIFRALRSVGAVVLALLVAYLLLARGGDTDGPEARRLVANGAALVDVRTPAEFAAGHLEGAANIPLQELDARIAEVGDRARPVVVYCRSGTRSAAAARMLRGAGYRSVHDLGAMSRW
ncbi:MAG: rhodanese-like domain-containing protein [Deltaproteobacteria bacterium]|nr:rhodanese-like domain-containing protein [Deltaproteobacteria bacterium]